MPQRRLTEAEGDDLATAYRAGVSTRELATRFNIERKTVRAHLERRAVARRQAHRLRADELRQAAELYENGLSLDRVGDLFGVDGQTIRRYLHMAAVAIKPRRGR